MSRRPSFYLRAIAVVLLAAFLSQDAAWAGAEVFAARAAAAPDPSIVRPSASFGRVESVHRGRGPLVVHIRDAHSNPGAQKNIASIVADLRRERGLKTVFLEGGTRDDSLGFLADRAAEEIRTREANRLVLSGELSGVEFLNVTSDPALKLQGVEDRALYDRNLRRYADARKAREGALVDVARIAAQADSLKRRFYPKELLAFDEAAQAFRAGRLSFSKYFGQIRLQMDAGRAHPLAYSHLSALAELQKREEAVNFSGAQKDLQALLRTLADGMKASAPRLEKLKRGSPAEIHFFEKLLSGKAAEFPALAAYVEYLRTFGRIDLEETLEETEAFERELFSQAGLPEEARRLHAISRHLGRLEDLFRMQISRDDFETLQADSKDIRFRTVSILAYLNRLLVDQGRFADVLDYRPDADRARENAEMFYRENDLRDRALVDNAAEHLRRSGESVSVLIAGGYHTENLKKLLAAKGFSYAVVSPNVEVETNHERYENALMEGLEQSKIPRRPMAEMPAALKSFEGALVPAADGARLSTTRRAFLAGSAATAVSAQKPEKKAEKSYDASATDFEWDGGKRLISRITVERPEPGASFFAPLRQVLSLEAGDQMILNYEGYAAVQDLIEPIASIQLVRGRSVKGLAPAGEIDLSVENPSFRLNAPAQFHTIRVTVTPRFGLNAKQVDRLNKALNIGSVDVRFGAKSGARLAEAPELTVQVLNHIFVNSASRPGYAVSLKAVHATLNGSTIHSYARSLKMLERMGFVTSERRQVESGGKVRSVRAYSLDAGYASWIERPAAALLQAYEESRAAMRTKSAGKRAAAVAKNRQKGQEKLENKSAEVRGQIRAFLESGGTFELLSALLPQDWRLPPSRLEHFMDEAHNFSKPQLAVIETALRRYASGDSSVDRLLDVYDNALFLRTRKFSDIRLAAMLRIDGKTMGAFLLGEGNWRTVMPVTRANMLKHAAELEKEARRLRGENPIRNARDDARPSQILDTLWPENREEKILEEAGRRFLKPEDVESELTVAAETTYREAYAFLQSSGKAQSIAEIGAYLGEILRVKGRLGIYAQFLRPAVLHEGLRWLDRSGFALRRTINHRHELLWEVSGPATRLFLDVQTAGWPKSLSEEWKTLAGNELPEVVLRRIELIMEANHLNFSDVGGTVARKQLTSWRRKGFKFVSGDQNAAKSRKAFEEGVYMWARRLGVEPVFLLTGRTRAWWENSLSASTAPVSFEVRLRRLREISGMTVIELAAFAGIESKFLREIEDGRASIENRLWLIPHLARALGVDAYYLYTGERSAGFPLLPWSEKIARYRKASGLSAPAFAERLIAMLPSGERTEKKPSLLTVDNYVKLWEKDAEPSEFYREALVRMFASLPVRQDIFVFGARLADSAGLLNKIRAGSLNARSFVRLHPVLTVVAVSSFAQTAYLGLWNVSAVLLTGFLVQVLRIGGKSSLEGGRSSWVRDQWVYLGWFVGLGVLTSVRFWDGYIWLYRAISSDWFHKALAGVYTVQFMALAYWTGLYVKKFQDSRESWIRRFVIFYQIVYAMISGAWHEWLFRAVRVSFEHHPIERSFFAMLGSMGIGSIANDLILPLWIELRKAGRLQEEREFFWFVRSEVWEKIDVWKQFRLMSVVFLMRLPLVFGLHDFYQFAFNSPEMSFLMAYAIGFQINHFRSKMINSAEDPLPVDPRKVLGFGLLGTTVSFLGTPNSANAAFDLALTLTFTAGFWLREKWLDSRSGARLAESLSAEAWGDFWASIAGVLAGAFFLGVASALADLGSPVFARLSLGLSLLYFAAAFKWRFFPAPTPVQKIAEPLGAEGAASSKTGARLAASADIYGGFVARNLDYLDGHYGLLKILDERRDLGTLNRILVVGGGYGIASAEMALRYPKARITVANKEADLYSQAEIERFLQEKGVSAPAIQGVLGRLTPVVWNLDDDVASPAGRTRFDAVIVEDFVLAYVKDKIAAVETLFNEHTDLGGDLFFDFRLVFHAKTTDEIMPGSKTILDVLRETFAAQGNGFVRLGEEGYLARKYTNTAVLSPLILRGTHTVPNRFSATTPFIQSLYDAHDGARLAGNEPEGDDRMLFRPVWFVAGTAVFGYLFHQFMPETAPDQALLFDYGPSFGLGAITAVITGIVVEKKFLGARLSATPVRIRLTGRPAQWAWKISRLINNPLHIWLQGPMAQLLMRAEDGLKKRHVRFERKWEGDGDFVEALRRLGLAEGMTVKLVLNRKAWWHRGSISGMVNAIDESGRYFIMRIGGEAGIVERVSTVRILAAEFTVPFQPTVVPARRKPVQKASTTFSDSGSTHAVGARLAGDESIGMESGMTFALDLKDADGTVIRRDDFTFVRRLGDGGGFGQVWLARDSEGREEAFKIFKTTGNKKIIRDIQYFLAYQSLHFGPEKHEDVVRQLLYNYKFIQIFLRVLGPGAPRMPARKAYVWIPGPVNAFALNLEYVEGLRSSRIPLSDGPHPEMAEQFAVMRRLESSLGEAGASNVIPQIALGEGNSPSKGWFALPNFLRSSDDGALYWMDPERNIAALPSGLTVAALPGPLPIPLPIFFFRIFRDVSRVSAARGLAPDSFQAMDMDRFKQFVAKNRGVLEPEESRQIESWIADYRQLTEISFGRLPMVYQNGWNGLVSFFAKSRAENIEVWEQAGEITAEQAGLFRYSRTAYPVYWLWRNILNPASESMLRVLEVARPATIAKLILMPFRFFGWIVGKSIGGFIHIGRFFFDPAYRARLTEMLFLHDVRKAAKKGWISSETAEKFEQMYANDYALQVYTLILAFFHLPKVPTWIARGVAVVFGVGLASWGAFWFSIFLPMVYRMAVVTSFWTYHRLYRRDTIISFRHLFYWSGLPEAGSYVAVPMQILALSDSYLPFSVMKIRSLTRFLAGLVPGFGEEGGLLHYRLDRTIGDWAVRRLEFVSNLLHLKAKTSALDTFKTWLEGPGRRIGWFAGAAALAYSLAFQTQVFIDYLWPTASEGWYYIAGTLTAGLFGASRIVRTTLFAVLLGGGFYLFHFGEVHTASELFQKIGSLYGVSVIQIGLNFMAHVLAAMISSKTWKLPKSEWVRALGWTMTGILGGHYLFNDVVPFLKSNIQGGLRISAFDQGIMTPFVHLPLFILLGAVFGQKQSTRSLGFYRRFWHSLIDLYPKNVLVWFPTLVLAWSFSTNTLYMQFAQAVIAFGWNVFLNRKVSDSYETAEKGKTTSVAKASGARLAKVEPSEKSKIEVADVPALVSERRMTAALIWFSVLATAGMLVVWVGFPNLSLRPILPAIGLALAFMAASFTFHKKTVGSLGPFKKWLWVHSLIKNLRKNDSYFIVDWSPFDSGSTAAKPSDLAINVHHMARAFVAWEKTVGAERYAAAKGSRNGYVFKHTSEAAYASFIENADQLIEKSYFWRERWGKFPIWWMNSKTLAGLHRLTNDFFPTRREEIEVILNILFEGYPPALSPDGTVSQIADQRDEKRSLEEAIRAGGQRTDPRLIKVLLGDDDVFRLWALAQLEESGQNRHLSLLKKMIDREQTKSSRLGAEYNPYVLEAAQKAHAAIKRRSGARLANFSTETREAMLASLAADPGKIHDVFIAGGGIVGANAARQAALEGRSVVLAEQGSFAEEVSSRSTALIHAGIRYLELAWNALRKGDLKDFWSNLGLVWAASRERKILETIAPDLVVPIRIYIPSYEQDQRSINTIMMGVIVYSIFARRWRLPVFDRSAEKARNRFPYLDPEGLRGGFYHFDAMTDDALLVRRTMRQAFEHDALTIPYLKVLSHKKNDGIFEIKVQERWSGKIMTIRARDFVDATGAFVDQTRTLGGDPADKPVVAMVRGTHLNVVSDKLNSQFKDSFLVMSQESTRIFFVIPRVKNGVRYLRIGTTEADANSPKDSYPSTEEVDEIVREFNRFFPTLEIKNDDIVSADAGIRPIYLKPGKEGQAKGSRSREHKIFKSADGVIHAVGVKLTDGRRAGEEISGFLTPKKGLKKPGVSRTTRLTRVPSDETVGKGEAIVSKRLWITNLIDNHMLMSFSDLMFRHGGVLSLRTSHDRTEALEIMARRLGWDGERQEREYQEYAQEYADRMAPVRARSAARLASGENLSAGERAWKLRRLRAAHDTSFLEEWRELVRVTKRSFWEEAGHRPVEISDLKALPENSEEKWNALESALIRLQARHLAGRRRTYRLSQDSVAEAAGMSKKRLQYLESGSGFVDPLIVAKVHEAMDEMFRERLRYRRNLAGWTRARLAAAASITPAYLYRIEQPKGQMPDLKDVERMHAILDGADRGGEMRNLRVESRLTIPEVAQQSGLLRPYIQDAETHTRETPLQNWHKMESAVRALQGPRLRVLREEADISIEALSEAVSLSASYLAAVERGASSVDAATIKRIYEHLDRLSAEHLRERREQNGLSRAQLSVLSGLSMAWIEQVESGRRQWAHGPESFGKAYKAMREFERAMNVHWTSSVMFKAPPLIERIDAASGADPEEQAIRSEQIRRVTEIGHALEGPQARVILRTLEGADLETIAEELGLSPEAAEKLLESGADTIRRRLSEVSVQTAGVHQVSPAHKRVSQLAGARLANGQKGHEPFVLARRAWLKDYLDSLPSRMTPLEAYPGIQAARPDITMNNFYLDLREDDALGGHRNMAFKRRGSKEPHGTPIPLVDRPDSKVTEVKILEAVRQLVASGLKPTREAVAGKLNSSLSGIREWETRHGKTDQDMGIESGKSTSAGDIQRAMARLQKKPGRITRTALAQELGIGASALSSRAKNLGVDLELLGVERDVKVLVTVTAVRAAVASLLGKKIRPLLTAVADEMDVHLDTLQRSRDKGLDLAALGIVERATRLEILMMPIFESLLLIRAWLEEEPEFEITKSTAKLRLAIFHLDKALATEQLEYIRKPISHIRLRLKALLKFYHGKRELSLDHRISIAYLLEQTIVVVAKLADAKDMEPNRLADEEKKFQERVHEIAKAAENGRKASRDVNDAMGWNFDEDDVAFYLRHNGLEAPWQEPRLDEEEISRLAALLKSTTSLNQAADVLREAGYERQSHYTSQFMIRHGIRAPWQKPHPDAEKAKAIILSSASLEEALRRLASELQWKGAGRNIERYMDTHEIRPPWISEEPVAQSPISSAPPLIVSVPAPQPAAALPVERTQPDKKTSLSWKLEDGHLSSNQGHRFAAGDELEPGTFGADEVVVDAVGIHPELGAFLRLNFQRKGFGQSGTVYGKSVREAAVKPKTAAARLADISSSASGAPVVSRRLDRFLFSQPGLFHHLFGSRMELVGLALVSTGLSLFYVDGFLNNYIFWRSLTAPIGAAISSAESKKFLFGIVKRLPSISGAAYFLEMYFSGHSDMSRFSEVSFLNLDWEVALLVVGPLMIGGMIAVPLITHSSDGARLAKEGALEWGGKPIAGLKAIALDTHEAPETREDAVLAIAARAAGNFRVIDEAILALHAVLEGIGRNSSLRHRTNRVLASVKKLERHRLPKKFDYLREPAGAQIEAQAVQRIFSADEQTLRGWIVQAWTDAEAGSEPIHQPPIDNLVRLLNESQKRIEALGFPAILELRTIYKNFASRERLERFLEYVMTLDVKDPDLESEGEEGVYRLPVPEADRTLLTFNMIYNALSQAQGSFEISLIERRARFVARASAIIRIAGSESLVLSTLERFKADYSEYRISWEKKEEDGRTEFHIAIEFQPSGARLAQMEAAYSIRARAEADRLLKSDNLEAHFSRPEIELLRKSVQYTAGRDLPTKWTASLKAILTRVREGKAPAFSAARYDEIARDLRIMRTAANLPSLLRGELTAYLSLMQRLALAQRDSKWITDADLELAETFLSRHTDSKSAAARLAESAPTADRFFDIHGQTPADVSVLLNREWFSDSPELQEGKADFRAVLVRPGLIVGNLSINGAAATLSLTYGRRVLSQLALNLADDRVRHRYGDELIRVILAWFVSRDLEEVWFDLEWPGSKVYLTKLFDGWKASESVPYTFVEVSAGKQRMIVDLRELDLSHDRAGARLTMTRRSFLASSTAASSLLAQSAPQKIATASQASRVMSVLESLHYWAANKKDSIEGAAEEAVQQFLRRFSVSEQGTMRSAYFDDTPEGQRKDEGALRLILGVDTDNTSHFNVAYDTPYAVYFQSLEHQKERIQIRIKDSVYSVEVLGFDDGAQQRKLKLTRDARGARLSEEKIILSDSRELDVTVSGGDQPHVSVEVRIRFVNPHSVSHQPIFETDLIWNHNLSTADSSPQAIVARIREEASHHWIPGMNDDDFKIAFLSHLPASVRSRGRAMTAYEFWQATEGARLAESKGERLSEIIPLARALRPRIARGPIFVPLAAGTHAAPVYWMAFTPGIEGGVDVDARILSGRRLMDSPEHFSEAPMIKQMRLTRAELLGREKPMEAPGAAIATAPALPAFPGEWFAGLADIEANDTAVLYVDMHEMLKLNGRLKSTREMQEILQILNLSLRYRGLSSHQLKLVLYGDVSERRADEIRSVLDGVSTKGRFVFVNTLDLKTYADGLPQALGKALADQNIRATKTLGVIYGTSWQSRLGPAADMTYLETQPTETTSAYSILVALALGKEGKTESLPAELRAKIASVSSRAGRLVVSLLPTPLVDFSLFLADLSRRTVQISA